MKLTLNTAAGDMETPVMKKFTTTCGRTLLICGEDADDNSVWLTSNDDHKAAHLGALNQEALRKIRKARKLNLPIDSENFDHIDIDMCVGIDKLTGTLDDSTSLEDIKKTAVYGNTN